MRKNYIVAILSLAAIIFILFKIPEAPESGARGKTDEGADLKQAPIEEPVGPQLHEANPYLDDYNAPNATSERDLKNLLLLLSDCNLIYKDFDRFHLPGNREIASFLQGNNPEGLTWLPLKHPSIDENGVIVDRSGKPIFFHRLSGTQFELRSAGKDGIIWTKDDLIVR